MINFITTLKNVTEKHVNKLVLNNLKILTLSLFELLKHEFSEFVYY